MSTTKRIAIVSAKRTPLGSFMGNLANVSATELGSIAIQSALQSANIPPNIVDEVFMGHVLQANCGQATARQAAIKANIPNTVPCTTINKVCASGLKAVMLGAQTIATGNANTVIAGGMENMSQAPHYTVLRNATKFGNTQFIDGLIKDGLTDAYNGKAMGICADLCAKEHSFSRKEQDTYAIKSYTLAKQAWENNKFNAEIAAVSVPQRKGEPILVTTDEEFTKVNFDKIPVLRPAFSKEGTVTAANASTINDGAGALVLMSEEKAQELNLKPLAYIVSQADAAQKPEHFTTAPALALPKALEKANLSIDDIDFFEINEAFAVVSLANQKLLNIPSKKLNVNGGAVALGHPLGCSGARILISLVHILQQNNGKYGAAAICNGGGGASSVIIENANYK